MEQSDARLVAARGSDNVFARIAAVASPLLPHEEAQLALLCPDSARVCRLLGTGHVAPELRDANERWFLDRPEVARFENSANGGRAWVRTPVRVGDTIAGVLVFFARPESQYNESDVARARWVADVVSVLAADGGLTDGLVLIDRQSDASIDAAEEVLREIAHVLDVRPVFPRISAIVNRILPHDRLTMTFHDPDGHVGLEAASNVNAPTFSHVPVDPTILARPFVLLPELTPEGLANHEPREAREVLMGSGFRSFLAVNVPAGEQRIGVEFWSNQFNAFSVADVPMAQRIANYVALAVSHEQLAEAARQMTEAQARERVLEKRIKTLSAELSAESGFGPIIGESKTWRPVLRAAARVAETEATVLLTGESGTGKEIVARFIHAASNRRKGPFVAVNCAALPEQLLESELFGYERGAFTGAAQAKPGQIEIASGGVLFLDEVSEMSLSAQAKFLRVLQEREFRRLGGTRLLRANVRIIAATNCDLHEAIERGRFRRDLYYRLRVFDLRLPPLRERRDDILPLSSALLEDIGQELARARAQLTAAASAALVAYDWPGNVRELRNVLERASILCEHGTVDVSDLSFDSESVPSAMTTNLDVIERETIEKVLRECRGNKSRAAKKLGLSRMQLYVRLRRYEADGGPVQ